MKKLWNYGTSTPFQRIGLIILSIGILSYLAWVFIGNHYGYDYTRLNVWLDVIFDSDYFPEKRDFIFFHFYLYLLPLGLLMTWGYSLLIKLKNWIMGENKKKPASMEIMYFKDNEAAFEMVCKYMDTSINPDKPVVAISLQDMTRPSEPIMIKVASEPPLYAHTATNYTRDHLIKKGDLLGVVPFEKTEYITSYMEDDERKQWLFFVSSELNPSFHSKKQMWSIKNNFLLEAVEREKVQNNP